MNLLGGTRQPFIGLALAAGFGILVSDLVASRPLPIISLASLFAVGACVTLLRPTLLRTYLIVGLGFFLLHNVRTTDTSSQQLAHSLGSRPRAVTATGAV